MSYNNDEYHKLLHGGWSYPTNSGGVTDEQIQEAVNSYLAENPVTGGEPGPQGPQGEPGPQGPAGDSGTILFDSSTGDNTNATIELTDDINSYSHVEIIYGLSNNVSSARALNNQTIAMSIIQSTSDCFKITTGVATFNGTQLNRGSDGLERQLIINHATDGQLDFTGSVAESGYYISIYRIIGYKCGEV